MVDRLTIPGAVPGLNKSTGSPGAGVLSSTGVESKTQALAEGVLPPKNLATAPEADYSQKNISSVGEVQPVAAQVLKAQRTTPAISSLKASLDARGRATLGEAEYESFLAKTLQPLNELLGTDRPDRQRWNPPTWAAFQKLTALLDSPKFARAYRSARTSGLDLARALEVALRLHSVRASGISKVSQLLGEGVNTETLGLLADARCFLQLAKEEILPSLTDHERRAFAQGLHTAYFESQLLRYGSTDGGDVGLLCPVGEAGSLLARDAQGHRVPEDQVLALLHPDAKARYLARRDSTTAGTKASQVKLTMADFVPVGADGSPDLALGSRNLLQFLTWARKDLDRPSSELGGQTIRQFVTPLPGEAPTTYVERLSSKQIFNGFLQDWDRLTEQAKGYGPDGEAKQLGFLVDLQLGALAAALVPMRAPSVLGAMISSGVGAPKVLEAMDRAQDTLWRVINTDRPFEDVHIARGFGRPDANDGIGAVEKEKSRALWVAIANTSKTRYLAGVADGTFDAQFGEVLSAQGRSLEQTGVSAFLDRLFRDLGRDNPRLRSELGKLDFGQKDKDQLLQSLHRMRFDPRLNGIDLSPGQSPTIKVGGAELTFARLDERGQPLPEFSQGTSSGFKVKVSSGSSLYKTGEELLLRLPKGARYSLENGALTANVHEPGRYQENCERINDHARAAESYGLASAKGIESFAVGTFFTLERPMVGAVTALDALSPGSKTPRKMTQAHVDSLVDLYVRGLGEVDEGKGRKHGVLFELGLHNVAFTRTGDLQSKYLDVCLLYRNTRERLDYGFFSGGYGSAAQWIRGDATQLSKAEVHDVWSGRGLNREQLTRRDQFLKALKQRTDSNHPCYRDMSSPQRDAAIAGLKMELAFIESPRPKSASSPAPSLPSLGGTVPASLGVDARTIIRRGPLELADPKTLVRPKVVKDLCYTGRSVTATVDGQTIKTTLAGVDREGRPVVMHNGQRRVLERSDLKLHPGAYSPSYGQLAPESFVKATPRQMQLMDKALARRVLGSHQATEAIDWLAAHGYESYLTGGMVRELVESTAPGSKTSESQALDAMRDTDLVSTAPPSVGRKMLKAIDPEAPNGNIDIGLDQWGTLVSGNPSDGLDFMSMAISGTLLPKTYDPFRDTMEVPSVFGGDLAKDVERRDFALNALYYDPTNHVIIDPTGHGIADAQNRVLRLAHQGDNLETNPTLIYRFWKFRARGYKPEQETLRQILQLAASQLHREFTTDPQALVTSVAKTVGLKGGQPEVRLKAFKAAMAADGAGALYERYIAPLERDILFKARQYAARAA